ncbi:hypothetical protein KUCAC02_007024, partial [Chaenocephalus aceratus]
GRDNSEDTPDPTEGRETEWHLRLMSAISNLGGGVVGRNVGVARRGEIGGSGRDKIEMGRAVWERTHLGKMMFQEIPSPTKTILPAAQHA